MFVRNFYFVRHGETILNSEQKRQGERGGLSPKGIEQAFKVGARLRDFKIKKILFLFK